MEEDFIGKKTLDVISEANNFNQWMYETIKPFTHGRILEIGSGTGNISRFFVESGAEITLSDFRREYCELLESKFLASGNNTRVVQIDLVHPDFEAEYSAILGSFDTLFALNVVEHIEDDLLAIKNSKSLLKVGGNLIILVPAYQSFFNSFDRELGHYRRYTRNTLSILFEWNQFKIKNSKYFNCMGLVGWYLSGSLLKKKSIPGFQMKLYNSLVPVFKIIDKIFVNRIGLSTIVVGRKI